MGLMPRFLARFRSAGASGSGRSAAIEWLRRPRWAFDEFGPCPRDHRARGDEPPGMRRPGLVFGKLTCRAPLPPEIEPGEAGHRQPERCASRRPDPERPMDLDADGHPDSRPPRPGPPLKVWIQITQSGPSFAFDPGRLLLKLDTGEPVNPVGYFGPGVYGFRWGRRGLGRLHHACGSAMEQDPERKRQRRGLKECFNCRNASTPLKASEGPIPLDGPMCFVLHFDVPASPENSFILSIAGLQREGASISGRLNPRFRVRGSVE